MFTKAITTTLLATALLAGSNAMAADAGDDVINKGRSIYDSAASIVMAKVRTARAT